MAVRPSVTKWLVVLVAVAVVAALAGWSARTLFTPPAPLPAGATHTVVEATTGEIERGLNLNVSATWSGGPSVVNGASGMLTEVRAASGKPTQAGAVLYTVDLAPVVIAQGAVPAFRTLSQGTRGADVRQLQELLAAAEQTITADGAFGAGTTRAVKAWQKTLGVRQSGVVELGSVIFVPDLPGVFAWADGVGVGSQLSPGSAVGRLLPATPVFTMTLPQNQRTLVEEGMPVTIFADGGEWAARLGAIGEPGEDGSAVARIEPAEGAESVCGEACTSIPLAGAGSLRARVTVIPRQEGTLVPTAALAVSPDGASAVIREDGTSVPIEVLAATGGQALVTGVEAGERIRVPGEADPAPENSS